jgi:hypothetical protein
MEYDAGIAARCAFIGAYSIGAADVFEGRCYDGCLTHEDWRTPS